MSEEVRDNMRIVWDAPIEMSDGIVLRADVFRPVGESTIPAILSYGPYAKGLALQEGFTQAWELMAKETPDVLIGSSGRRTDGRALPRRDASLPGSSRRA